VVSSELSSRRECNSDCDHDAGGAAEQARWFRAFWASPAPKVGEPGAKGFNQWVAEQHGAAPVEPIDAVLAGPAPVADAPSDGAAGWTGWLDGVLEDDVDTATPVSLAPPRAAQPEEDSGQQDSEREANSDSDKSDEDLHAEALPGDEDLHAEKLLRIKDMRDALRRQAEQQLAQLQEQGLNASQMRRLVELEAERARAEGPPPGPVRAPDDCRLCKRSPMHCHALARRQQHHTPGMPRLAHVYGLRSHITVATRLFVFNAHDADSCLSDLQAGAWHRAPASDVRHVLLFGAHPDATRLLLYGALAALDVPCTSASGYLVAAATPASQRLRDSNCCGGAAAHPLAAQPLSTALGLSFCTAAPARDGGADLADAGPDWLRVASFEAMTRSDGAGAPAPWYARSPARHAFVRSMLLQMLAPGGRFSGDPGLIRALFHVEATPILSQSPVGGQAASRETLAAAGEHARKSAKRWLQEPMLAKSLSAWSAFAALEESCGRHRQAMQVLSLKVTYSVLACAYAGCHHGAALLSTH
jgi:hypothetical protein